MDSGYVLSPLVSGVGLSGSPSANPALLDFSFPSPQGWRQQDESDGGFVETVDLLTAPALVMCYVEAEPATWAAIEADARFVVIYREPMEVV